MFLKSVPILIDDCFPHTHTLSLLCYIYYIYIYYKVSLHNKANIFSCPSEMWFTDMRPNPLGSSVVQYLWTHATYTITVSNEFSVSVLNTNIKRPHHRDITLCSMRKGYIQYGTYEEEWQYLLNPNYVKQSADVIAVAQWVISKQAIIIRISSLRSQCLLLLPNILCFLSSIQRRSLDGFCYCCGQSN